MKVSLENLSATQKKVDVVIPVDVVKEKRAEVFGEIRKTAKIKGFRPGKAPAGVVESMFKKEILGETATRLVTGSLEEALKEVSAHPISRPEINPPDPFEMDKDFEYSAIFDVLPEVELSEYKGLPIKKEVSEITDHDVEHTIQHYLEHKAEARAYEGEHAAEKGDVVIVDFEGFLGDEPVNDLKREGLRFVVGEGRVIPEFEENVVGMKKDEEKEFDVEYGEDFQIKEAAGKTVRFKFRVKDVQERIIPELTDELAKEVGQENAEELKKSVKKDLEAQAEQQTRNKLRQAAVEALVEKNAVEAPQSLVNEEVTRLARNTAQGLQQRGIPASAIGEEAKAVILERADKNVRASILLAEIAKKESITATEDDIDKSLSEVAAGYNVTLEQVREIYRQNDMLEGLHANLVEQKVIDFIIENAAIEEVKGEPNHVDNK